ncbi:hypothetical protein ACOICV_24070, partial [Klebsiella pneumoniae]|uniref:hypothetical protein n=3 Tax=Klebsiella pneumoniae TaxID=573 RepID=UPI003B5AF68B
KRAYCLKTQPATGETYPKSDLFNKAACNYTPACRWAFFFKATLDGDKFYKYIHNSASTAVAFTEVLLSKPRAALILLPVINHAGLMKRLTSLPG